jgi:hypothetical protein
VPSSGLCADAETTIDGATMKNSAQTTNRTTFFILIFLLGILAIWGKREQIPNICNLPGWPQ